MKISGDISRISVAQDSIQRAAGSGSTYGVSSRQSVSSPQPTPFTTSQAYRELQDGLREVFQDLGFQPDQAEALVSAARLPPAQLARLVQLAQTIKTDEALFAGYLKTTRQIALRGAHGDNGLKVFFDSLEAVLSKEEVPQQVSTQNAAASNSAQAPSQFAAQPNSSTAQSLPGQLPEQAISANSNPAVKILVEGQHEAETLQRLFGDDLNDLISANAIPTKPLTPLQVEKATAFLEFASQSVEEFPDRYPVDLYAASQLSKASLSLPEYVELASSLPPLRLLNLVIAATKQGHPPRAIFDALIAAQKSGDDPMAALEILENRFGAMGLGSFSSDKAPANSVSWHLTGTTSSRSGAQIAQQLAFVAFDAKDGAIPPDKSAVWTPMWSQAQVGQEASLKDLPMGLQWFLLGGLNAQNQAITAWVRARVEKEEEPEEKKSKEWDDENFSDQQEQREQREPRQERPQDVSPLTIDLSTPAPAVGPFLGEIILPLAEPHSDVDVLLQAPNGGVVVDAHEYHQGTFVSHAVRFRFLAGHVESTDSKRRRAPLTMVSSAAFSDLDRGLRDFIANPQTHLEKWREQLGQFFSEIRKSMSGGETTFELAEKWFVNESEAFANGKVAQDVYRHDSREDNGRRFVAACYSRGAAVLAGAGDVSGALNGYVLASLTDLGNPARNGELGGYLEALRRSGGAASQIQDLYSAFAEHASSGETNTGDPATGEAFLLAIRPPEPPKIS